MQKLLKTLIHHWLVHVALIFSVIKYSVVISDSRIIVSNYRSSYTLISCLELLEFKMSRKTQDSKSGHCFILVGENWMNVLCSDVLCLLCCMVFFKDNSTIFLPCTIETTVFPGGKENKPCREAPFSYFSHSAPDTHQVSLHAFERVKNKWSRIIFSG